MADLSSKIIRRLAVWLGLLSLALSFLPSPVGWASHQGPPLIVDAASPADEDGDGDYHFKTIQAALGSSLLTEYATISVKPGRYSGDIIVAVEGVKLHSLSGALQTIIQGTVTIRARSAEVAGFSIEAGEGQTAVVIEGDGALLFSSRIYEAAHGVWVEGAQNASIRQNQIYNHSGDALVVQGAWHLDFVENELRGNGGAGGSIADAQDSTFDKNIVRFNRFGGLWVRDSERLSISENSFQDNDIIGLSLDGVSQSEVGKNLFVSNEAGLVLTRSIENVIQENLMRQGRSAGLVVKNASHGNRVEGNTIQGNQGRGATGIRLAGDVFDNEFVKNQVTENGAGLVLAQNESGTPANNFFGENEFILSDSRGIQIEPFAERNRFVNNRVVQNLQEGVANSGDSTLFERNDISQNGSVGLLFKNSQDAQAEGNTIRENGAAGILLEDSTGALLTGNEVLQNVRDGIQISGSQNLRLLANKIVSNGSGGLSVNGSTRLTILDNNIEDNRDVGASFLDVNQLVFQQNEISENGLGGVLLDRVSIADLESNHFAGNVRYGLSSTGSEKVSALRNFWGDAQGPSGTFAGHGDAVLGLPMEQVTPWLPATPGDLDLHSISGAILDSPEGPRIVFDATDRLGLILELYNPGWNGADLANTGIVLAARFQARPESLPPLDRELGFYSISVEGLNTGSAEITLLYREENQPMGYDPTRAQLFLYKDGAWRALPGTTNPDLRRVTGEISMGDLQGAVIGLGTFRDSQTLPVVQEPKRNISPWLGLKGINPGAGSTLLLMLIALSPLLVLLAFYGLVRSVRRGAPLARRRMAYIFRIWNL